MLQRPSRSNWPYCDSTYPDAFSGEKDSCGVGFIANVEGKQNNWVLSQALRGLSCMEHRGGCGGDSATGARGAGGEAGGRQAGGHPDQRGATARQFKYFSHSS